MVDSDNTITGTGTTIVNKFQRQINLASPPFEFMRRMAVVDWSELPEDVVARIVENHLVCIEDYVMVSNVCRSWHRAVASCDKAKLEETWAHRPMPWLMLTDGNEEPLTISVGDGDNYVSDSDSDSDSDEDDSKYYYTQSELEDLQKLEETAMENDNVLHNYKRDLLNLWQNNKRYSVDCPEGYGRLCWGSPYGWIVTTGADHNLYLFNPLTRSRLDLPSRLTFPRLPKWPDLYLRQHFISKAVVLKVPSDNDGKETIMVVAIYFNEHGPERGVAIAKPGDKRWMPINGIRAFLHDVIYHRDQGLLLFVNIIGGLAYCDLRKNEQPLSVHEYCYSLLHVPNELDYNIEGYRDLANCPYIASFGKDVFMVLRSIENEYSEDSGDVVRYKTIDFKVYKFCFYKKNWDELLQEELPNINFFVGNNTTMYVYGSDQEVAAAAGSDHNRSCSIYFTDDYKRDFRGIEDGFGGRDMGVFRMCDKSISLFSQSSNFLSSYCCPIWFRPSL